MTAFLLGLGLLVVLFLWLKLRQAAREIDEIYARFLDETGPLAPEPTERLYDDLKSRAVTPE